jgi:hypothetical protein
MPIEKRPGESKDQFISRCIEKEISSGMTNDQAAAVCYTYWDELKSATASGIWSGDAPVSIEFESYSDYPESAKNAAQRVLDWADKNGYGDCLTPVGKQRANQLAKGEPISKDTISRMAAFARHLQYKDVPYSEGCGGMAVDAWGGQAGIEWAQRKLEEIESQKLSLRKVLFNEDFNEEEVKRYKDLGFKVLIRSRRKYKKRDKKVWNKLKSVGLTEDNLVFGEVTFLHKKYNFDILMTGQDPVLEKLRCSGQDYSNWRVIKSKSIKNLDEALEFEKSKKDIELKFITIKTVYSYKERPDVPPAESGSRPFCVELMKTPNRKYTINEIMDLGTKHLTDMGLPSDPFLYRGGFYTTPGGQRGANTTPYCRHEWIAEVVIQP